MENELTIKFHYTLLIINEINIGRKGLSQVGKHKIKAWNKIWILGNIRKIRKEILYII